MSINITQLANIPETDNKPVNSTSLQNTPDLFAGAYGIRRDFTTGLDYMRYRWYSNDLQRFTSPDPLHLMNRYAYVNGNPVKYVDPMGLQEKGGISATANEGIGASASASAIYNPYFGPHPPLEQSYIEQGFELVWVGKPANIVCYMFARYGFLYVEENNKTSLTRELKSGTKFSPTQKLDECNTGAIIASHFDDDRKRWAHYDPIVNFFNLSTEKCEQHVVFVDGITGVLKVSSKKYLKYMELRSLLELQSLNVQIFNWSGFGIPPVYITLLWLYTQGAFGPNLIPLPW